MTNETAIIIAAVVGVGGLVLGATIQTFGKDLICKLFATKKQHYIDGKWNVIWEEDLPNGGSSVMEDVVELSVDNKGRITGKGISSEVNYKLEGWDSSYAITLAFSGFDMEENLVGTVLIEKGIVNRKMEGYWCQITREKQIVGGRTIWTRHNTISK